MMNRKNVAPELALAATVSGSITIIVSLVNIVLCVLAIIYRFTCDAGQLDGTNGALYFMHTLYRVYIQDDTCSNSQFEEDLTRSQTVFILTAITLAFAVLSFIVASALISAVINSESSQYLSVTAYVYIGVCVSILIVDLTFATHFGIDFTTLSNKLNEASAGLAQNYEKDVLRLGAFVLVSIILKGYIYHIVNTILLVYVVIYSIERHRNAHRNAHNIHKLGALNAYDYPRSHEDSWPTRTDAFGDVPSGHPQWNNRCYTGDEIPRAQANPAITDVSSRAFERSESWLRSQPSPHGLGGRPFSYLEEPKRSQKPTASEQNWPRDWPSAPPVPAPDYSPPARRLKSALKQGYP
ncbi:unnamed protein product [Leptosia nina]|uniref:Uncharacterized protein n=1 Tax=Leptosia nina TaxID=320188 RepID=A0AAV1K1T8_9NEOP